jgi:hypothetical protein
MNMNKGQFPTYKSLFLVLKNPTTCKLTTELLPGEADIVNSIALMAGFVNAKFICGYNYTAQWQ